ncbi:TIGR03619 family F420-dependent LLM class oxidoreductase [Haliea sp. E1-2-M8]|uniref:TIGR03619 family F420-dependent LLM class oxidoreductase n=1 Tax=Haliea sp. E1-2-M8 TaxID=3064706 RepID=UPI002723F62B|nr:TIGR03619 family F420-dependent LLM class oxidoreductase [Haliea sp. E1-2-M8]MDO8863029.1 TIGR03619 family F420-dependent LLM class oxidoreductase [Haliea sp. E1-2-M8]
MAKSIRVGVTLYRISHHTNGDIDRIMAIAEMADAKGIDMISVADHLCFTSDAPKDYPMGPEAFPGGIEENWFEPITLLAAFAARTRRIQLSTALIIAPARSAVLLAKQFATLDYISKGRVIAVFGAGWQRAEFTSQNLPFQGRFTHMEEQIQVCRALWSGGTHSFHGKFINFDDLQAYPLPVQGTALPIWLGVSPTERNLDRMARFADGWLPATGSLEVIRDTVSQLKPLLLVQGRNPDDFDVRGTLVPILDGRGRVDLDASFAQGQAMIDTGITVIDIAPLFFSPDPDDIENLLDRLVQLKQSLRNDTW